jgi:hypothetical protein
MELPVATVVCVAPCPLPKRHELLEFYVSVFECFWIYFEIVIEVVTESSVVMLGISLSSTELDCLFTERLVIEDYISHIGSVVVVLQHGIVMPWKILSKLLFEVYSIFQLLRSSES